MTDAREPVLPPGGSARFLKVGSLWMPRISPMIPQRPRVSRGSPKRSPKGFPRPLQAPPTKNARPPIQTFGGALGLPVCWFWHALMLITTIVSLRCLSVATHAQDRGLLPSGWHTAARIPATLVNSITAERRSLQVIGRELSVPRPLTNLYADGAQAMVAVMDMALCCF